MSVGIYRRSCYAVSRVTPRLIMFVYWLPSSSLFISSTLFFTITITTQITQAVEKFHDDNDVDKMYGEIEQFRVSELGSYREDNLNCFLQFDQVLSQKWRTQLNLVPVSENNNNNNDDKIENDNDNELWTTNRTSLLKSLNNCMNDITKSIKNPGVEKCMNDLIKNEIESDDFISIPELFDDSLPLPFLTFFNIRELVKLLFANQTESDLSVDEMKVIKIAGDYIIKDKSGRDKVFVIDQSCEWKNLASLRNLEGKMERQLSEFKQQVIRLLSLKISQGIFSGKDLKPGTWISVYRRWIPVRLQNIKDLESTIEGLKTQKFTAQDLCGYATTLANYFAEKELKLLLPQRFSPLKITIGDIKSKVKSKENRLCEFGTTNECARFRGLKKSYEDNLKCVQNFGELFSNHMLYSIIQKYADIEPRITYPEIACKKSSSIENIAITYCRCVGSFCTNRNVGEIKANRYKLYDDVVTRV